jgi:hypothetical protein
MLLPFVLGGCWKTYDKSRPDDYYNYWQDKDHVRDSVLYQNSSDFKEDRRKQFEVDHKLK